MIGIDLSRTALGIARRSIIFPNSDFIEMDAENIGFNFRFDKVTCQYGLMFFPDSTKTLKAIRETLRTEGKIVIAVHGLPEDVPYFSTIMRPILKHIPDIKPDGTPTVHRFGDPKDIISELSKAGFSDISVTRHEFVYEAGTFEEYWNDYMNSTANSIRAKLESHGKEIMDKIKKDSLENATRYEINDNIVFPWTVLVASGMN